MKLKKVTTLAALMMAVMALSACGRNSKSNYSTTGTSAGNYQGVIKKGHYRTSKARGVNVSQNNNQYNLKSFESGLTTVSKRVFSTKNYIFQEGQYLDTDTVTNWLGRKTKKNPEGLNPAQGKKSNPNPEYIQQLEEQDYMTESGSKLKLKGMTIGIGINSEYNYKKKDDGPSYTKKISNAEVERQGKIAAEKVLKRLRARKDLQNIPIVIALYKQAPDDSLVGGTFFAYSNNKGDTISSWHTLHYRNEVLPKAGGTTSENQDDSSNSSSFSNFKSQVQSFFPNLSGVTAQAQYNGSSMTGMHITITTQFYSQSEITSFTQYITRAARRYLPSGIPIDIKIQSDSNVQAVVFRNSGSDKFQSHVFDSY